MERDIYQISDDLYSLSQELLSLKPKIDILSNQEDPHSYFLSYEISKGVKSIEDAARIVSDINERVRSKMLEDSLDIGDSL